MLEIGHDLRVLHVGAGADGFVARPWLFNTLQLEAGFDQQIQPLAYRPRKPGSLELRQHLLHLRRRCSEEPFSNLPFEISEVVSHLNRVGQSGLVSQIPPMLILAF